MWYLWLTRTVTKPCRILIWLKFPTTSRLIALLQAGDINFEHLQHLILDEADRMLDMGFFDDIRTIINYLPKKRQSIMFSATMPPKIRMLANQITVNAEQINIAIS